MDNDKISNIEFGFLSTFLYKAFILLNGFNIIIDISSNDSIISSIIGLILGIIIINVFIRIFDKLPTLNIFEKANYLFGKYSIIIKLLLIISVSISSSYLIYITSLFIKSSLLINVDILPISILFFSSSIYLASKGITSITRSSIISFIIFIFFEIMTILFIIPNINSLKILPLFTHKITNIIYSSVIYLIMSIFPIFLLLIVPKSMIKSSTTTKSIKIFHLICNIYLIFNFILTLSIIDARLASIIDYPELSIISKISILNFFDRMEDILSFKFLLDLFITLSLSIFYIKEGITLTNKYKKYNIYIIVIAYLLILFISNYIEFNYIYIIINMGLFILINMLFLLKK